MSHNTVLISIQELTPRWLTHTLRASGALPAGEVVSVTQTNTRHMVSRNYFLTIDYTPDAPVSAPRRLFFKMSDPAKQPLNATEVDFYARVAAAMPDPPIPRCYSAEFDAEAGSYHILLHDLSETHTNNEFPLPARIPHAEQMVDALADLHAFWWDHPHLNDYAQPPERQIPVYVAHNRGGLAPIIDLMGDRLPTERRQLLELVFDRHEQAMLARAAQGKHLTFIHSDSHTGNFLLPRDNENGRAYMVDRQLFDFSLDAWVGVSDLAYLWCHWWQPERRRALEIPLLRRYHERMQALGVTNYSWEQLWLDYRLTAIQSIHVAIEWGVDDGIYRMAWVWYPQLLNALVAFDDLDGRELLG
jgi:hypothetical protein